MSEIPEGFIAHDGGKCPVAGNVVIRPFYRGPADPKKGVLRSIGEAWRFTWHHDGEEDDIIAYAVHQHKGTDNANNRSETND